MHQIERRPPLLDEVISGRTPLGQLAAEQGVAPLTDAHQLQGDPVDGYEEFLTGVRIAREGGALTVRVFRRDGSPVNWYELAPDQFWLGNSFEDAQAWRTHRLAVAWTEESLRARYSEHRMVTEDVGLA